MPIGLGPVAVDAQALGLSETHSSGETLGIRVALDAFTGPVDIYLAIDPPGAGVLLVNRSNELKDLFDGIVRWKENHTGPLDESLFGDIAISSLPRGAYAFHLFVTPSGRLDEYYAWTSGIEVP